MERRTLRRRALLGGLIGTVTGVAGYQFFTDSQPSNQDERISDFDSPPMKNQDERVSDFDSPPMKSLIDGAVVPIAAGLGADDIIDPTATATPIADAITTIDDTGDQRGFGAVLLPPTEVTEAGPITLSQYVDILGWGSHTSQITFTDSNADGFRVTGVRDGKFVTLDGFTISGGDSETRSGGSAIHFVSEENLHPKHFDIGALAFRDWIDPVIYCESGSPYDCLWGHLDFGFDRNHGREFVFETNQGMLGSQIRYISAGNATRDPVIYTNFAGLNVNIDFINVGGSASKAVAINASNNGHVRIGGINFEPVQSVEGAIVSIRGNSSVQIEHILNTNSNARSMVELQDNNGNNIIGPLQNNGSLRTSKIEVTESSTQPSFYFGSSSDIVSAQNAVSEVIPFDGQAGAGKQSPIQTLSGNPADALDPGELGLATNYETTDPASLVFKDDLGTVYRWEADSVTRS